MFHVTRLTLEVKYLAILSHQLPPPPPPPPPPENPPPEENPEEKPEELVVEVAACLKLNIDELRLLTK